MTWMPHSVSTLRLSTTGGWATTLTPSHASLSWGGITHKPLRSFARKGLLSPGILTQSSPRNTRHVIRMTYTRFIATVRDSRLAARALPPAGRDADLLSLTVAINL